MDKGKMLAWLDEHSQLLTNVAQKIWENPELPFAEKYAADLQSSILKEHGFTVKPVKNVPTAFVAEYGQGHPIIGIMGEYDALAELSNKVSAAHDPVVAGAPGHACGHNLLGTAGMGAALALKLAIDSGLGGMVRYYGCPAEETLAGKVFMAREGVFDDLDGSLYWHPASFNALSHASTLAMNSVEFTFHGVSAHAAAAPHMGRSALDAVELMNVGANYLREHIHAQARIHYVITNGGGAPNIVPAKASVWYYVRAPKREIVEETYARLINISRGAALMTDTTVEPKFIAGCYDNLPNETLGSVVNKNIEEIALPKYSAQDREFAAALAATTSREEKVKTLAIHYAVPELTEATIHEGITQLLDKGQAVSGSIDTGDISWKTPFAMFRAATWPVGIASHTWQGTAASGSDMAYKGMMYAAKVLAGTVFDLLTDQSGILNKAKAEFTQAVGNQTYKTPLPDDIISPIK
jgi:amidohydrolase